MQTLLVVILSFANSLLCVFGLFLSKSIFAIYWAIALFIVGFFPVDYFTEAYAKDVIAFANIYSLIFNCTVFCVQRAILKKNEIRTLPMSHNVFIKISNISVLFALIGLVAFILSIPSFNLIINMSWQEICAARTGRHLIFYNISTFSIILSTALIIPTMTNRKKWGNLIIVIIVIASIAGLSKIKSLALPACFTLLVAFNINKKRFVSIAYLKSLTVLILIIVVSYWSIAFVRYIGPLTNVWNGLKDKEKILEAVLEKSVESELRVTYYSIVDYFSEKRPLYGTSYIRILEMALSGLTNEKVSENPMYLYAELTDNTSTNLMRASNHPTIYGDAFANFKIFGVIVAFLGAYLMGVLWKYALRLNGFFLYSTVSVISYGLPLIMRGSVFYGIYSIAVGLSFAGLLNLIFFVLPGRMN